MINLCDWELQQYGGSIDVGIENSFFLILSKEDTKLLDSDTLSFRAEMAVWFRRSQKKSLKQIKDGFIQMLQINQSHT